MTCRFSPPVREPVPVTTDTSSLITSPLPMIRTIPGTAGTALALPGNSARTAWKTLISPSGKGVPWASSARRAAERPASFSCSCVFMTPPRATSLSTDRMCAPWTRISCTAGLASSSRMMRCLPNPSGKTSCSAERWRRNSCIRPSGMPWRMTLSPPMRTAWIISPPFMA